MKCGDFFVNSSAKRMWDTAKLLFEFVLMSECFFCRHRFDRYDHIPRVIPCGHTFC